MKVHELTPQRPSDEEMFSSASIIVSAADTWANRKTFSSFAMRHDSDLTFFHAAGLSA
jgi:hypothetical protein